MVGRAGRLYELLLGRGKRDKIIEYGDFDNCLDHCVAVGSPIAPHLEMSRDGEVEHEHEHEEGENESEVEEEEQVSQGKSSSEDTDSSHDHARPVFGTVTPQLLAASLDSPKAQHVTFGGLTSLPTLYPSSRSLGTEIGEKASPRRAVIHQSRPPGPPHATSEPSAKLRGGAAKCQKTGATPTRILTPAKVQERKLLDEIYVNQLIHQQANQIDRSDLSYLNSNRSAFKLKSADQPLLNAEALKPAPKKQKVAAKKRVRELSTSEAADAKAASTPKAATPQYKPMFLTEQKEHRETKAQKQMADNELIRTRHELADSNVNLRRAELDANTFKGKFDATKAALDALTQAMGKTPSQSRNSRSAASRRSSRSGTKSKAQSKSTPSSILQSDSGSDSVKSIESKSSDSAESITTSEVSEKSDNVRTHKKKRRRTSTLKMPALHAWAGTKDEDDANVFLARARRHLKQHNVRSNGMATVVLEFLK